MSSVTFSGLASGIDTASIVKSIIEVESAPITALENKKSYLQTKLDTYTEFNSLLKTLNSAVTNFNNQNDLKSFEVTNKGSDYFSVTTSSLSTSGNYSIKVISLAQQQKDVSNSGIADTDKTALSGELQIGEQTLNYSGTTLSNLADLVNNGDYGVTASIIDDGAGNGYRLMLTAKNAGEEIAITGTGSILFDTSTDGHIVEGSRAHLVVDGVDYYSSSNTVTNAIKGSTITLLSETEGTTKNILITSDTEKIIASKIEAIVSAYNEINTYVNTIYSSDSTLGNSLKSVQRGLKNFITNSNLLAIGIQSSWETGELTFDSSKFSTTYTKNPSAVILSLVGDSDNEGIMNRFDDYLTEQLKSTTGFLANKKSTINKAVSKLEDNIDATQARLDKRQSILEAQFAAMETLVSSLNSQASYLTNFFDSYNSSS